MNLLGPRELSGTDLAPGPFDYCAVGDETLEGFEVYSTVGGQAVCRVACHSGVETADWDARFIAASLNNMQDGPVAEAFLSDVRNRRELTRFLFDFPDGFRGRPPSLVAPSKALAVGSDDSTRFEFELCGTPPFDAKMREVFRALNAFRSRIMALEDERVATFGDESDDVAAE
jgi:hypothetical protein